MGVKAELGKAKGFILKGLELTVNETGKKNGTDAKDAVAKALVLYSLKKKKFEIILKKLDGTFDKIKALLTKGDAPKTVGLIGQAIKDAKLAEIEIKKD